jgi:hypothetical protein
MSNIKTHRANGIDWLIVEVPSGASTFSINSNNQLKFLIFEPNALLHVDLPEGNYELIATLDEITEDQAEQAVKIHIFVKRFYRNYDAARVSWANTAKESLHSLIRSLFPEHANNNYVILKQIKQDEQQSVYGC